MLNMDSNKEKKKRNLGHHKDCFLKQILFNSRNSLKLAYDELLRKYKKKEKNSETS